MSWEKPFLDEASLSAFSSKNTKEKTNSTTMQALHDSKHTDNSNGRSCSEKDSGFSDTSSDCKHTDAKDQSNEKQQRETSKETVLNHNESLEISHRRNVIVAPGTQQLPPFYIIKNMVQPHIDPKNAPLIWPSGAKPTVSGANPVILLQPSTPQFPQTPGLSQSDVTAKKINAAHLPVKSYARIAPHPSKKPANKTTQNSNAFNQSKRVCIENNNAQATHEVVPSTSRPSYCNATVSATQPTPSVSSVSTTELNKHSVINTRHRRFLNTVQVLKQSGLLDITLRTKELMRQSNATRRDIAQLRQHSDRLCHVASSSYQSPSNQMEAWINLNKVMAESGAYPGLEDVQAFQVPTSQQDAEPPSVKWDSDERPVASDAGLTEPIPQQVRKSREDKPNETLWDKGTTPDSLSDD